MADIDIELVIKIPEDYYEALRKTDLMISGQRSGKTLMSVIYNAVAKGTPLPKGHGRLIILSEDAVKRELERLSFSNQKWISEVGLSNATVTIIEADEEVK